MEKKQTSFFTPAKPAFIAAFVLFVYTVAGQKMQTFKDHCGSSYASPAHLYRIKQVELDFNQFKSGQTAASTGAWEKTLLPYE